MRNFVYMMILLLALSGGALLLGGCVEGSSGSVTLLLYDDAPYDIAVNAAWAAFQDGDGPWQAITPASTGVYTQRLSDAQGRYGFALVDDSGDLHLVHGTTAEGAQCIYYFDSPLAFTRGKTRQKAPARARERVTPGWYTLTGSISYSGFSPTNTAAMVDSSLTSSSPTAVYGTTVAAGLHDVAVRDNGWTTPWETTWLYLERDIDVQSTMTHNITVSTDNIITLTNPGASLAAVPWATNASVSYRTLNGTRILLASNNSMASPLAFRTVPASAAIAGDLYEARVAGSGWETQAFFANPTGMAVSAPSSLYSTFDVSSVVAGGLRFPVFEGLSLPAALGYVFYCDTTDNHYFYGQVSANWLTANGATACQVPNLSALTGWQTEWSLPSTADIDNIDSRALAGNAPFPQALKAQTDYTRFVLPDGGWVTTHYYME